MIDVNTYGECTRISPEAPVQVVKYQKQLETLGGVGNNLTNLHYLNIPTDIISVAGDDDGFKIVNNLTSKLSQNAIIIKDNTRPTTIKNRIIAHNHQVLRLDTEETHEISSKIESEIIGHISKNIKEYSIIMISDYNKGVCTKSLIHSIVSLASQNNIKVLCDPKKSDVSIYSGCYIITPNKKEAEVMLSTKIKSDNEIHSALIQMLRFIQNPVITLSEDGIAYLDENKNLTKSKALAREVVDVTGAGDTAISTICYGIYHGMALKESIDLANKASSIVVSRFGTSFVTEDELKNSKCGKIIKNYKDIIHTLNGKSIVFTNGCFDIIHRGHAVYLKKAKELGDILIVGINSDESVKNLKGDLRPINDLESRMEVLSSLECVDYVIPFSTATPYDLIKEIKPKILAKGGDYEVKNIIGNDVADKTVVIPFEDGFSTTKIIEKITKK